MRSFLRKDDRMREVIVGSGMGVDGGIGAAQSGVFASVDVYEQTKVPSTASPA